MEPVEIVEQMEKFTVEEKERINLLAAGKIDEITQEDMELFARWKTSCALCEARFQAEREAALSKAQAEIEQRENLAQAALANLEAQRDLALARLEMVKNGQI